MRDVPDSQLNALQLRVKKHTLSGAAFFDEAEAQKALAEKFIENPNVKIDISVFNKARITKAAASSKSSLNRRSGP